MSDEPNTPSTLIWPNWQKQLAGLVLVLLVPAIFVFFRPVITTMLIIGLLAFILRYPINFLHRRFKLSYNIAALLVFFLFLLLSIWAFIALTGAVISAAITLLQQLQTFLNAHMPAPPESLNLGPIDLSFLSGPLQRMASNFVISQVFGGPAGIVNGMGHLLTNAADLMGQFAIIVTILLFFLLEIPTTIGGIGKLFPENSRREYAILIQRSDKLLTNYFFGSLLVVGFYWLLATILFAVTGVSDALVKGFIVGLPNFIPQVGGYISTIMVFFITLISGSDKVSMSILVLLL
ncbi:MAG: AI-2E family transporter [Anaerolineae bacterium]|nr:AI-2E family transporter [Anaerolineae bacterium]